MMSVMNICRLEASTWNSRDISLRQPCRELTAEDLSSAWLKALLLDMYETLYSAPSGVGLAAPQVGIQLKLIVVDIKRDTKKPLLLINPSYVGLGTEMKVSVESCLSVPGVVGRVSRYEKVLVKYIDIQGNPIERECSGFESTVMQHEIDHINGIVYVDRLIDGTSVEQSDGHIHRQALKSVDNIYSKKERTD